MPLPTPETSIKTVAELRAFLDKVEANWSAEASGYLGEFKDLAITIPYFKEDGTCMGYGSPVVGLGPTLDLTFETPKEHR